MNLIDKVVAAIDPVAGMKRVQARKAMQLMNTGYSRYGASTRKAAMRSWEYHGGSEKEDIEDNLNILRQRSRDAYMGVPIATGALKTMRTNTVGSGLVPTPQIDAELLGLDPTQAAELQAQIMREFSIWADSTVCDAAKMDNFYGLQMLAFMSFLMNGDSFAVLPMEKTPGQPYDLRVQLIEADRVCSPNRMDVMNPATVQGFAVQKIVQGVETDSRGAVTAYWITDRHPLAYTRPGVLHWQRVDAFGEKTGRRNVLHVIQRERVGQKRGVPVLAPVLESLKQLGRYSEAELDAAVIAACQTFFVEHEGAGEDVPLGENVPENERVTREDEDKIEIAPGAVFDLREGEKMTAPVPARPNANFNAFFDAQCMEIGAGIEMPVEVMFKKFSTSFSSARGALNEFWRTCGMMRDTFADSFCQPIYEEWFAEAVAKGRIRAPGFFGDPAIRKAYTNCSWNGPARTNLNPVQEVDAAIKRVEAGFSTAEQEAAQMTGQSYAANMRQRIAEAQQKKEVDKIGQSEERAEE